METKTRGTPAPTGLQDAKLFDVALFCNGIKEKIKGHKIGIEFGNYVIKWVSDHVSGFTGRYGYIDDKKLKKDVDKDFGKGTYNTFLKRLVKDAYESATPKF